MRCASVFSRLIYFLFFLLIVHNLYSSYIALSTFFQVKSGLADWLAGLPIVLLAGDALVVHAGIPLQALTAIADDAPAAGKTVRCAKNTPKEGFWK